MCVCVRVRVCAYTSQFCQQDPQPCGEPEEQQQPTMHQTLHHTLHHTLLHTLHHTLLHTLHIPRSFASRTRSLAVGASLECNSHLARLQSLKAGRLDELVQLHQLLPHRVLVCDNPVGSALGGDISGLGLEGVDGTTHVGRRHVGLAVRAVALYIHTPQHESE